MSDLSPRPMPQPPVQRHVQPQPTQPPGWYRDNFGTTRWWDGSRFTEHVQQSAPPPQQQWQQPIPVQPDVRQSRDRAQYVRQQKGHSLILHVLLGGFLLYIPTIYYAVSPNHYFHA